MPIPYRATTAERRLRANELAAALDGRRTPRGWRARCPGHDDHHPSLDIEERDSKILFIDRSGRCTQGEIIDALRTRGLWTSTPSRQITRTPAFRWEDNVPAEPPAIPACCVEGPCEHWREFDRQVVAARLTGYLVEAAAEMIALYKTAKMELGADELRDELTDVADWNPEKLVVDQYLDAEQVRAIIANVVRGLMW